MEMDNLTNYVASYALFKRQHVISVNYDSFKTTKVAASALKAFIFLFLIPSSFADLQSYMYGLWSAPFIFGIAVGQKVLNEACQTSYII